MGILLVLIFWFVALSVIAAICSGIMTACAYFYLRGKAVEKKKPLTRVAIFPFACVLYAGAWFIVYATINGFAFNRDPMLGDGWYTDIPNGYRIEMIDVTDQGNLRPSGTDINGPSAIEGVRRLQIAAKQIFGTRDTKSFDHLGTDSKAEDAFFALDTTSHSIRYFTSQSLLQDYAATQGVHLSLLPIERIYEHYRYGWFDWLSWAVLVGTPAAAFALLVRWFIKLVKRELDGSHNLTNSTAANADSLRE